MPSTLTYDSSLVTWRSENDLTQPEFLRATRARWSIIPRDGDLNNPNPPLYCSPTGSDQEDREVQCHVPESHREAVRVLCRCIHLFSYAESQISWNTVQAEVTAARGPEAGSFVSQVYSGMRLNLVNVTTVMRSVVASLQNSPPSVELPTLYQTLYELFQFGSGHHNPEQKGMQHGNPFAHPIER